MADIKREYKLRIQKQHTTETVSEQVVNEEIALPYSRLREKYCNQHNITTREFEEQVIDANVHVYVQYAETPWNTADELMDELRKINGVNYVVDMVTQPQYSGQHPKALVESSLDQQEMTKRVKEYFDGLEVKTDDKQTYIIFYSPVYHARH